MLKVTRSVASGVLALALSGVALADGGITHGPGFQSPPPTPATKTDSAAENTGVQYSAVASELTWLIVWLEQSIL